MSVSGLFYIIGGQFLFASCGSCCRFRAFQAAGRHPLPCAAGAGRRGSGIGTGARRYRTFFLEEIGKDFVRTARAKGLSEARVLFRHVLSNALVRS